MENVYGASKLRENLWRISEGGVCCFLCVGTDSAMLIDTGFGKGDIKAFAQTLTDKPIFVLNTHADGDHTGCNELFGRAMMHPAEFSYYKSKKQDDKTELLPVWEGEVIDIGTMKFEVILIPGHTPGSIALLDRENRFLISGDSIQKGSIFMFGQGRNLPAYIFSMEKMLAYKDSFDVIYPSHGAETVSPEILPDLIDAAKKLLAGELEGEDPQRNLPCKLYRHGGLGFLY